MKLSGNVSGKEVALHTILEIPKLFLNVILPNIMKPEDDQIFKIVCSS